MSEGGNERLSYRGAGWSAHYPPQLISPHLHQLICSSSSSADQSLISSSSPSADQSIISISWSVPHLSQLISQSSVHQLINPSSLSADQSIIALSLSSVHHPPQLISPSSPSADQSTISLPPLIKPPYHSSSWYKKAVHHSEGLISRECLWTIAICCWCCLSYLSCSM